MFGSWIVIAIIVYMAKKQDERNARWREEEAKLIEQWKEEQGL